MNRRFTIEQLRGNFPIVNPDGTASEYFLRLLFGNTDITAEQEEDIVSLGEQVTVLTGEVEQLELDKADKTTEILGGFGLSGGGDLSASRTLELGDPALTDPGADRLLFWDDSAGQLDWLELGTNLSIAGNVINAAGGGGGSGSWSSLFFHDVAASGNLPAPTITGITANEILIVFDDIVFQQPVGTPLNTSIAAQVSVDNGATFVSSAANYVYPNVNNIEVNDSYLRATQTAATAARSSVLHILNAQYAGAPKVAMTNGDPCFMPTVTAVINAIRLMARTTTAPFGTFTAGRIYVLGR